MADLPEVFVATRFSAEVRIRTAYGEDLPPITDIVSVSATFALNTIPTATILFATGKNTLTNANASIHDVQYKIGARDKIVVYLNVLCSNDRDTVLKSGRYKIFDGFIAGTGYQRAHNHANFVINAVHWLDDLNNSTAINGDWLPGAPSDYARAALLKLIDASANSVNTGIRGAVADLKFDNISAIKKDLWGESIRTAFLELAKTAPKGTNVANNQAAVDALARMPNKAGAAYYKPLALAVTSQNSSAQIEQSVKNYYKGVLCDATAQNSFWAKLVANFAADFMFAVSPAVDWAFPIPFCGGLRWKEPAITIKAKDYSYGSFTTNMSQIIEAVHVVHATEPHTGRPSENPTTTSSQNNLPYYKTYASYPPAPAINATTRLRGLKLFKRPPIWLAGLGAGPLSGLHAAQAAMQPGAPPGPNAARLVAGIDNTADSYAKAANIVERVATHWYCTEVLQQRSGEISGPLRFDIAPGSIVKIETPTRDIASSFVADNYVVSSVVAVSYVINSERATAGTSFIVAHTRTPVEEANTFYTVPTTPLYTAEPFYGGPLAVQE